MTNNKKIDRKGTLPNEDIPAILRVCGEECDPNFQDVPLRDMPKHLRERYWIKQLSPTNRWQHHGISMAGWTELRLKNLNRKLDDAGDAFFDLILSNFRYRVHVRTWIEVTEVFLPEHAPTVNGFVREYNGLRGRGQIDPTEFLQSLNLGPPNAHLQRKMADQVICAIKDKAQKGREGGSYQSLARDYGRGTLIVGLPLFFATYPSDPADPSTVLTDFVTRLAFGLETIERSVLRKNWCPFDTVVVLWNPTLESVDSWVKVADPNFYADPAAQRWQTPISLWKMFREPDLPTPDSIILSARWDRYSSLNAILADQYLRFRLFNQPRPFGPKACLDVTHEDVSTSLRMTYYIWLFQLWLFVCLHGWRGLRRWIFARFSISRLYSRMRSSYRARKLFRSS